MPLRTIFVACFAVLGSAPVLAAPPVADRPVANAPVANAPVGDTQAADTTGFATEKPAEGPFVEVDGRYMVPYSERIPGTDVTFEMVPVPGGTYLMGSPENDPEHREDEEPLVKMQVDPMWVAKHEVTWAEYDEYMNLYAVFKEFEARGIRLVTEAGKLDAITAPTELYDPSFTYEYGKEPDEPAVTMTQYAAKQYSKWLSRTTGRQYRLPTEAEWEYACRGGTRTAYSWGDSADEIDQYAWYFDNADSGPMKVGSKKPNPFGLHDMHGNVAEWTVNAYTEDGYTQWAGKEWNATKAVRWPESAYPCVVRGGSWELDPADLRSAARLASDDEAWKEEDPNYPRSPWWFTSDPSRGVGFRLFRSYKPVDNSEIANFWEAVAEDVKLDVESRLIGGRGGLGTVDPDLPQAIRDMQQNRGN